MSPSAAKAKGPIPAPNSLSLNPLSSTGDDNFLFVVAGAVARIGLFP
jgi:hypothetical protein